MSTGRVHATYELKGSSLEEFKQNLAEIPLYSTVILDDLINYAKTLGDPSTKFFYSFLMMVYSNSIKCLNSFIKNAQKEEKGIIGIKTQVIGYDNISWIDGILCLCPISMKYNTGSNDVTSIFNSGIFMIDNYNTPNNAWLNYISYVP